MDDCALFRDSEHSEEDLLQLSILLILNITRTLQVEEVEVTGTVLPSSPAGISLLTVHLFQKICSIVRLKCEWIYSSLLKWGEHKRQGG